MPCADYERVRASPHSFVVASGHAAEVDDVLVEGEGLRIVGVKREYRDPDPPTADRSPTARAADSIHPVFIRPGLESSAVQ